MKICNYKLNVDRVDMANWYELKIKAEERRSFVGMALIFYAPVGMAMLITRCACDFIGITQEDTWILEIAIIEFLVIVVMAVLITTSLYGSGKLYRRLRKNGNMSDMLRTLKAIGEDSAFMHIAYILYFNQYISAEVLDGRELVVVYTEDGVQKYYRTHDFYMECPQDCTEPILLVDPDGVHIVRGGQWVSVAEAGGYQ